MVLSVLGFDMGQDDQLFVDRQTQIIEESDFRSEGAIAGTLGAAADRDECEMLF